MVGHRATVVVIPLADIDPNDTTFELRSDHRLKDLLDNLTAVGQQMPIVVRHRPHDDGDDDRDDDRYQVVLGFRRFRAARKLGWSRIHAVVRDDLDDVGAFQLAYIDNACRQSLSGNDRALAVAKLRLLGLDTAGIAALFGVHLRSAQRYDEISRFPEELTLAVRRGAGVTASHGLALTSAARQATEGELDYLHWIRRIEDEHLSVAQLRRQLRDVIPPPTSHPVIMRRRADGGFRMIGFAFVPGLTDDRERERMVQYLGEALMRLRDPASFRPVCGPEPRTPSRREPSRPGAGRAARTLALLAVGVLLAAGQPSCSEQELASDLPSILLTWPTAQGYPDEIRFGDVETGALSAVEIAASNVGLQDLEITTVSIDGAANEATVDAEPVTLSAGEGLDLLMRFIPLDSGAESGWLDVVSNAREGTQSVPWSASGFGDPIPDIVATPAALDFGEVELLDTRILTVEVTNAGPAPLTIAGLSVSGPAASEVTFDVDDLAGEPLAGAVIEAGDEPRTIEVGFTPLDPGTRHANLDLASDDPDEPVLSVPLTATGWSDGGDGPVALCRADPPIVAPLQSTTWIGHESFDPAGHALTSFSWTLWEAPTASAAELSCETDEADCGPFVPDVAGAYTGRLEVTNDQGQSSTCSATLDVVPDGELWVELYWTLGLDDLDLHLVSPGGQPWTDGDCFFDTCRWSSPDWGTAGDPDDDPRLVIDDVVGTGPELIRIAEPADGIYTVFVHDYTGTNPDAAAPDPGDTNVATVHVYLHGVLAYSAGVDVAGEGAEVYVCTIEPADDEVLPW
jgi:ParB/RepB/Spo0J family partition protein